MEFNVLQFFFFIIGNAPPLLALPSSLQVSVRFLSSMPFSLFLRRDRYLIGGFSPHKGVVGLGGARFVSMFPLPPLFRAAAKLLQALLALLAQFSCLFEVR